MPQFPPPTVVRAGAPKPHPFTVLIVANPALEAPWNSGAFVTDPICGNKPAFDACVAYINSSLFGLLPQQAEPLLGDPGIAAHVRVLSLFKPGLPATGALSLVAQDGVSNLLVARRNAIKQFLQTEGLEADVVYAVSGSATHQRASAWFTTDDDARPGDAFLLDGVQLAHRHFCLIPGTVALPVGSKALTAVHEFQHAVSSYSNGMIVDQYATISVGVNVRKPQPPPAVFGHYAIPPAPVPAGALAADLHRLPIGYPPGWTTFHCERHDPLNPAIMDNYWLAPGGVPEVCQNDKISRRFVLDRVKAKLSR